MLGRVGRPQVSLEQGPIVGLRGAAAPLPGTRQHPWEEKDGKGACGPHVQLAT